VVVRSVWSREMTSGPLKGLFVIDSLYPIGGVERSFSRLLANFDRSLVVPRVVVLGRPHPQELRLPSDVPVDHLQKRHVRCALQPLSGIIRAQKPDIIHSAKTHVNTIAVAANLLAGRPSCAIPSERVHLPAHVRHQSLAKRWKWHATLSIAGLVYRKAADKVVFVSQGALEGGCERLGLPRSRATVIYNPVVDDALVQASHQPVDHPWFAEERDMPVIVGVGRLTKQKGFSYLLRAFQRVRGSLASRLVLVGEGEDLAVLRGMARKLQVGADVAFLGFQSNPYKYMARADAFVLPSLWEGFGLVLVEALAAGAPVIATRCPSGPEEIVTDGVDGLLVPPADSDALADAIINVLTSPMLAHKLSEAGRRRADEFQVERAVARYQNLFRSTLAQRRAGAGEGGADRE